MYSAFSDGLQETTEFSTLTALSTGTNALRFHSKKYRIIKNLCAPDDYNTIFRCI